MNDLSVPSLTSCHLSKVGVCVCVCVCACVRVCVCVHSHHHHLTDLPSDSLVDGSSLLEVANLIHFGYIELRLTIEWARRVPGGSSSIFVFV